MKKNSIWVFVTLLVSSSLCLLAHARLRTNGVVMNTDSWYDLYNVNQNHLLYLPVERRTHIW